MLTPDVFEKMKPEEKYIYTENLARMAEAYRVAHDLKSEIVYHYAMIASLREDAARDDNNAATRMRIVDNMETRMKDVYGEKGETQSK
jgi:hypothetical protein